MQNQLQTQKLSTRSKQSKLKLLSKLNWLSGLRQSFLMTKLRWKWLSYLMRVRPTFRRTWMLQPTTWVCWHCTPLRWVLTSSSRKKPRLPKRKLCVTLRPTPLSWLKNQGRWAPDWKKQLPSMVIERHRRQEACWDLGDERRWRFIKEQITSTYSF